MAKLRRLFETHRSEIELAVAGGAAALAAGGSAPGDAAGDGGAAAAAAAPAAAAAEAAAAAAPRRTLSSAFENDQVSAANMCWQDDDRDGQCRYVVCFTVAM